MFEKKYSFLHGDYPFLKKKTQLNTHIFCLMHFLFRNIFLSFKKIFILELAPNNIFCTMFVPTKTYFDLDVVEKKYVSCSNKNKQKTDPSWISHGTYLTTYNKKKTTFKHELTRVVYSCHNTIRQTRLYLILFTWKGCQHNRTNRPPYLGIKQKNKIGAFISSSNVIT